MLRKSGLIAATITATLAISITTTTAHDGATGIVKERMDVMGHVGGTMKLLSGMAKGDVAYDGAKASAATQKVAKEMAGFAAQFPEGSTDDPSEAGPAIWTNNAEFVAIAKQLEDAAAKATKTLAGASDNSVVAGVLGDMGKTCKACHSKFRVKR